MATVDLEAIEKRTVSVTKYLDKIPQSFSKKFLKRKQSYRLDEVALQRLRSYVKDIVIVVFSAEWCKDCAKNIPVLASIAEITGMKIRVFGGLKADPLNPKERWRIPPSPPEVKTFNVQRTPTIIVFDRQGKQLGAIIENPRPENTLEEEILQIIQHAWAYYCRQRLYDFF